MTVRIAIVGGGIAGLSCAVAVSHLCPDVHLTLLERRPTLQAVGAGIVLWPNAIRALQHAGVPEEQLDAVSLRGVSGGVRASDGRWLSRSDIDVVTATVGRTAALRRADLLELLRTHVPEGVLQRGCAVTEVSAGGTLTWENAEGRVTEQFDLVVAADGLRSTVRGALWPGVTPVDSGVTAWRWLAPDVGPGEREGFEMWGPEGVMGVVPLAGAQRYLYAAAPSHVVTGNPHDDLRRFAHWADPIPSLIANATDVLCHPLADLPPAPSYVRGTVVLIGDAAHGMLPFLGQGACMGIEDAATLATLLASRGASARRASGRTTPSASFAGHTASASPADADATASSDRASTLPHILRRFDAVRVPRCRQMQARSRDAGRMALLRNPLLVAARNAALRVVPAGLAVQALADVTRWSPPE